jgi:DNA polymerase III gamma/tau subunit
MILRDALVQASEAIRLCEEIADEEARQPIERTPEQRIIEALKKMTHGDRDEIVDALKNAGLNSFALNRDLIRAIEDLGS